MLNRELFNNRRIAVCHTQNTRLHCFFAILGVLCCMSASAGVKEDTPLPLFNVGYQVLDFKYRKDDQEQMITVAVWYPTAVPGRAYNYGGPTSGNVAIDAKPLAECAPYPLLVFSHGYGGSGLGAVFLTEALAARGWIVVCPDHQDRHSAVRIRTGQLKRFNRFGLLNHAMEIAASAPGDRDKYQYRLDELKHVLDGILASDVFGQLTDKERIAVGGHSFGGFTALGLSGAIKELHDSRIKAVLLFSTGAGGYLYSEDELNAVQIPLMLFLGEREKDQRRGSETMSALSRKIYASVSPPKYFLEVKGADHFSFNNRFSDNYGAKVLSGSEAEFDVIRRYSVAFLEKHVAGRGDSGHVLERSDPGLTRYAVELVPKKVSARAEQDVPANVNKLRR